MKKKSIIFISSLLILILCATIFSLKVGVNDKKVFAQENNDKKIIVIGKGEFETNPDKMSIEIGLKNRFNSINEGKTSNQESLTNLENKLKEFDENAIVKSTYSFSRPVFFDGDFFYEFENGINFNSSKVEEYDNVISMLKEYDNVKVRNVSFSLNDNSEAYKNALLKAKENAEEKANYIFQNARLISIKEEPVFNFCENCLNEKIKINAMVKACFSVDENVSNDVTKTTISDFSSQENQDLNNSLEDKNQIVENQNRKLEDKKQNEEVGQQQDEQANEKKEEQLENNIENETQNNDIEQSESSGSPIEEENNIDFNKDVKLNKKTSDLRKNKESKIPDNTHEVANKSVKKNRSNEKIKKVF